MDSKPDLSAADLRRSLTLYRKLLSLIRASQSEAEVIQLVMDAIHEEFPECRASFSRLKPNGDVVIVYSRQNPDMKDISGQFYRLQPDDAFLLKMWDGQSSITPDIRNDPVFAGIFGSLKENSCSLARIDIPTEEDEGGRGMISLTHLSPREWDRHTVELLAEISELVRLMLRETRAQERLKKSEELLRQFTENINVVVWMTDLAKNVMLYINPVYEQIWGRSRESLYADPLSFLLAIHPEDRERVTLAVQRQKTEPYEEVYRVVRPNGEIRWVKDRAMQVRDAQGKVYRIVGLAEDITELHEAQEQLESTQARVVSNAKFMALGEMASGIAHEINNPLAVIHGLSVQLQERLRSGGVEEGMLKDSLASMEKMANRIAAIVKGLRTFSRKTATDPLTPADMSSIVCETMAMCDPKLRLSKIEHTLSLPPVQLMVSCRSSELSQVILNLVSNSCDALAGLPKRWLKIVLDAREGMARLSVEDSGSGIPPHLRDRIFHPFFTTKDVGNGIGLGLSLSKGIAEAHGGRLFLDATCPNTRFILEIPLEAEPIQLGS